MAGRSCPRCQSPLVDGRRPYAYHGVFIGRIPALVCSVCSRIYHTEAGSREIEARVRALGLWPGDAEVAGETIQTATESQNTQPVSNTFSMGKVAMEQVSVVVLAGKPTKVVSSSGEQAAAVESTPEV